MNTGPRGRACLAAGLVLWGLLLAFALATPARAQSNVHLRWVELSVGGMSVRVNAGGVATLHPDAPFRVLGAKTDSWLDVGLSFRLEGLPTADPNQYHTLVQLLGKKIYTTDELVLQVLKSGQVVGEIRLLVRLLPIDWLRRARAAKSLDEKITYTTKALALTPDDALLAERLADLLIEAGRWQEAADLMASHARSQPDPRWLAKPATLSRRLGDNQRAAATLSKLVALRPDDQELLDRLAKVYVDLKRWDGAGVILQRLAKLIQGDERAQVLARLAIVREKAGKPDQALEALKKAIQLAPRQAGLFKEMARLQKALGNNQAALAALDQAAALSPRDRALHLELAAAYLAAKKPKAAAREYEKVHALKPDDPAPLLTLAKLYTEVGDRKALASVYQRLAKTQPDDPDLQYNLAVLLAEQGRTKAALGHLEAAAKLKPQDQGIQRLQLDLLIKLKRWNQALALAEKLIKVTPEDMALVQTVFDGLSAKRPQQVADLLDTVLEAKPKSVQPYQMRAALALDAGDDDAAIKALNGAAKIKPKDTKLLFQLAGMLEAQGEDKKALALYERILDQDPEFPEAEERYLVLRTKQLRPRPAGSAPAQQ